MKMWATDSPGTATDWIEFTLPGRRDEESEDLQEALRRYRINVSFMLSKWKCIFGQGCPGILRSGAMTDRGCCQIGVHLEDGEDFERVERVVHHLTPDDADLYGEIQQSWYYMETDEEEIEDGYSRHTRLVDGACVFANRAGGPTGKLGCSLHILANRLGIDPSETKPDICWQIPISVTEELDGDTGCLTVSVTATAGHIWGSTDRLSTSTPGWWCIETPDAYVADELVFKTNETSLRKQMGNDAYEMMVKELEVILSKGGRRYAMPGEVVNAGRPLIPLFVEQRKQAWKEEGREQALARSQPYFKENNI